MENKAILRQIFSLVVFPIKIIDISVKSTGIIKKKTPKQNRVSSLILIRTRHEGPEDVKGISSSSSRDVLTVIIAPKKHTEVPEQSY